MRLRRVWISLSDHPEELAAGDLSDAWAETELAREGHRLVLMTPFDFGDGDPFDNRFGDYLRQTITAATNGAVRDVAWRYMAPRRRVRRASTSDLDIYRPGDPLSNEYEALSTDLWRHLPSDTTPQARDLLATISAVAFSRHRVWFSARSGDIERQVGKTPGAAYALHAVVRGFQKADPLYTVYSDPWLENAPGEVGADTC